jgi:membrane-bound serine protease (ClpP class)
MSEANWWLTGVVIAVLIALISLIVYLIVRTYSRQPATGREELKGMTAEVKEPLAPQGTVLLLGELWDAVSTSGRIESGEEVVVNDIKGLKLWVSKKAKE